MTTTHEPYTLKQLDGFRHAPDRVMRRLVLTAELAIAEAAKATEALQESKKGLLVVLHRDGFVEVIGGDWQPVAIGCLPDLGRGREQEAEEYMLKRIPMAYRTLYTDGRRIAAANCRGCMNLTAYKLLQVELETMRVMKDVESELATV